MQLQMSKKVGYAMGDMGISISYFAVGFFFMYYLTDMVGMDPLMAGTAFFIGRLWDGVNDPLMGIISDRTVSSYGRKRVYILFGALPFALSFMLLWMLPQTASQPVQFVLAVLSLLFYSTAYTVVVVPYMALVPVMTNDYDERTQITGMRAIFSTLGTILGGSAAMLVSSFTSELTGLRIITFGFALFSVATLLIAARSVRGIEEGENHNHAIANYSLAQYLVILKERNVLILLVMKLVGAVATGCLTASIPYFAVHILGSKGYSTIGLAIYVAVSALAVPVWQHLTTRYDKRRLLLTANFLAALVLVTLALFLQKNGAVEFYIGCALLGSVMAGYLLIPYSLVPDLVEFYQYKTGERHESVFFGLWMTVHQLGIAAAGLVLGFFLSVFGYQGEQTVQSAGALMAIRASFGLIPGIFLVTAALVLQKYDITREVYDRVKTELARRAGELS